MACLALLSPSGVGPQRVSFLFKALPLLALGDRGRRRLLKVALGPVSASADSPPADDAGALADFALLIFEHFRPRLDRIPRFPDEALRRLTSPLLLIVGGRDALLDSRGTRRRLERAVPHATVRFVPDAGHYVRGQTAAIGEFVGAARR